MEKIACNFQNPMTLSVLLPLSDMRSNSLGRLHKCGDAVWIAVHHARIQDTIVRVYLCLFPATLLCPVHRYSPFCD